MDKSLEDMVEQYSKALGGFGGAVTGLLVWYSDKNKIHMCTGTRENLIQDLTEVAKLYADRKKALVRDLEKS